LNPWEQVPLAAYEAHMSAPQVGQLQALSAVIKRQLKRHSPGSVCVLGVAGGNGLEHIDPVCVRKVYGVDVSEDYLDACAQRFVSLGDALVLLRLDLKDEACRLPQADLVIANLLVEYIGADTFARLIASSRPAAVCCAVQQNVEADFVSVSPCADALQRIGDIHEDIAPETLAAALEDIGYRQVYREDVSLPNGKRLICMDFVR
jgi:hypothetical protein